MSYSVFPVLVIDPVRCQLNHTIATVHAIRGTAAAATGFALTGRSGSNTSSTATTPGSTYAFAATATPAPKPAST